MEGEDEVGEDKDRMKEEDGEDGGVRGWRGGGQR